MCVQKGVFVCKPLVCVQFVCSCVQNVCKIFGVCAFCIVLIMCLLRICVHVCAYVCKTPYARARA